MNANLQVQPITTTSSRAQDAMVGDGLKRYLADIRRHPLLSREEEMSLARRAVDGDAQAITKLVNSNLRLVVKIALEYKSSRYQPLDLIQEGNVGLLHAIRKFDPERDNRLATYAQFWIRAYVLKYLMDNYKLVKIGTTQAQRKLFYNLKKAKESLIRQGLEATPEQVAEKLSVRRKDVVEMERRLNGGDVSLDAPFDEDGGTMMDVIPAQTGDIATDIDRARAAGHLRERFAAYRLTLEGREAAIWDQRLISDEPMTLSELGQQFGVSRERARQLQARILKKLGNFLNADQEYIDALSLLTT